MSLQAKPVPQIESVVRPTYRADIDGLRAIAVLSVVFYHYWTARFVGGYFGVDVFFVISGYLLGSIVISEEKRGTFSFSKFYERRIRRIFPALFFLLACTTAAAFFLLLSPDLASYLRSEIAATLSASNFYFWQTGNYFGEAIDKPLLHTWSLAVEEQFYIAFPLFVVLVHRFFKKSLPMAVLTAMALSFAWYLFEIWCAPTAAFYLPLGRAWELLFGTALALRVIPVPRSQVGKECLAAGGILGIAVSVIAFSSPTSFLGLIAALPCAAAGAIILAGQHGTTLVGRILSWKPVVFIGLISYSLYLWHWPLLSFSAISILQVPSLPKWAFRAALLGLSFLISAFSWRFIETPMRTGPRRPSGRTIYIFGGACAFASCALCLGVYFARQHMHTIPAAADNIAGYETYSKNYPADFDAAFHMSDGCFIYSTDPASMINQHNCLSPVQGKSDVLIWGDSHAANLRYGLESAYPSAHFLQVTAALCPPLLTQPSANAECQKLNRIVVNTFLNDRRISTVVLSANWQKSDLGHIEETINVLHGKGIKVVVIGPLPGYDNYLPRYLAISMVNGKKDVPHAHLLPESRSLDAAMERMARETWHVPYISPFSMLCSATECVEYAEPNVPLEFDFAHLTRQGSKYVGQKIYAEHPDLFAAQQRN